MEMFMKLDERIRNAEENSRKFYTLSIEINKTIMLDDCNRPTDGNAYLTEVFNTYTKLIESCHITDKRVKDRLLDLPPPHGKEMVGNSVSTMTDKSVSCITDIENPTDLILPESP
jgi:hypothetical protein